MSTLHSLACHVHSYHRSPCSGHQPPGQPLPAEPSHPRTADDQASLLLQDCRDSRPRHSSHLPCPIDLNSCNAIWLAAAMLPWVAARLHPPWTIPTATHEPLSVNLHSLGSYSLYYLDSWLTSHALETGSGPVSENCNRRRTAIVAGRQTDRQTPPNISSCGLQPCFTEAGSHAVMLAPNAFTYPTSLTLATAHAATAHRAATPRSSSSDTARSTPSAAHRAATQNTARAATARESLFSWPTSLAPSTVCNHAQRQHVVSYGTVRQPPGPCAHAQTHTAQTLCTQTCHPPSL